MSGTDRQGSSEKEVCEWSRGATPGVYMSSCSLVPFLHNPEPKDDDPCPYCDGIVKIFGPRVEYDERGQVQHVK
jgi:hypothetical protein